MPPSLPHWIPHWIPADIPAQTNRRALITGANSGIGFHAALELVRHGAHVLLASRDARRGAAALARIRAELPQSTVEVVSLDLASLASVRALAALLVSEPLDLLINNAGVYAPKQRTETADGFDLQFGTNVLGHFALTALMLPALGRAAATAVAPPRIVTLASIAHKRGRIHFEDLQSTRGYSPMGAYQQSKLADLMLAFELDRRLRAAPAPLSRIESIAAHPGVANTNLFVTGDFHRLERSMRRAAGHLIGLLMNDEAKGAIPTLYAATAPDAISGAYYGPQGFFETRGSYPAQAKIAPQALDLQAATRLWHECERLTGCHLSEELH
jgi:NAD(P)-dependent dehydrogenase (short-subunit alcohol dehydrogenase family)